MDQAGLNLADAVRSIRKHFRSIAVITLIAAAGGAIFYMMRPPKYKAKIEFLVRNPLYGDRTIIYSNEVRLYDYFANEDDLNKVVVLAGSEPVQRIVIRNTGLAAIYKKDTEDIEQMQKLERMMESRMNVMRTENRAIDITYTDTDPRRAVAVANEYANAIDRVYGDFFRDIRKSMYSSVQDKLHEQDSTIDALTDTLVAIRDQYGIYSSRYTYTLNSMKDYNKKYGRGIEQMMNIESIRDALIGERAAQINLVNRYKTGLNYDQLAIVKIVSPGHIVSKPGFDRGLLIAITCGALGAVAGIMIFLFSDAYLTDEKIN